MTNSEARLKGKAGGLATVARHGPDAIAARAREGLWRRFEREAERDGVLPPAERHRRATLEQRRYYAVLTIRSMQARALKRKGPAT
ncbi:MAG: hypothetical protein IIC89_01315 [Chloroflexi bacterium]|nr:hypothetical protein [Chloroflexota bacterium]